MSSVVAYTQPRLHDTVIAGLWSDQLIGGWGDHLHTELPHADGPYVSRPQCQTLARILTRIPQGFIAPDIATLRHAGSFTFALPAGHRVGRKLCPTSPDASLVGATRSLAMLHNDAEGLTTASGFSFTPPMLTLISALAVGRGEVAIVSALSPVRRRIVRAANLLRHGKAVLCHGRWSIGSMTEPLLGGDSVCVLIGPDLFRGPPAADLGYLCGDLLEAMIGARLCGDMVEFRSRMQDIVVVLTEYGAILPLNIANVIDMAAARVAAHLAASQALRRRCQEVLIRPAEALAILSEAARVLKIIDAEFCTDAEAKSEGI